MTLLYLLPCIRFHITLKQSVVYMKTARKGLAKLIKISCRKLSKTGNFHPFCAFYVKRKVVI